MNACAWILLTVSSRDCLRIPSGHVTSGKFKKQISLLFTLLQSLIDEEVIILCDITGGNPRIVSVTHGHQNPSASI